MAENYREIEWQQQYSMGRQAYDEGKPEECNPYGKGQLMLRCAWAGGWNDRRREVISNQVGRCDFY